jgi:tRNA(Ile)-lysidine synthase
VTSAHRHTDAAQGWTLEQEFLQPERLVRWANAGVLLAVSGGADSTAMLRCFVAYNAQFPDATGMFHVAHVNHALRGCESDDDAMFVRQLAEQFGLTFHETRLTPESLAANDSGSFEAVARKLRYDFLQQTAEYHSLRYVAVAHNADDQAETILHRIIRGTGVAGLAGIPLLRSLGDAVSLIRPMLTFSRRQILAYLDAVQQPFRTDSTNAESHYTRNKIRNELLPQLASGYNHAVSDALIRLGTQAAEWSEYIKSQTDMLYDLVVTCHANHVTVQLEALAEMPRLLVRELFVMVWMRQHWHLRDMTFAHWKRLADMTQPRIPAAHKQVFPGGVIAERTSELLIRLTRQT